jgi:hypothetical protein
MKSRRPVNSNVRQLSMRKFLLILVIGSTAVALAEGQRRRRDSPLLKTNRPGVYISFLRVGKIKPLETGVADRYLWFRITNNTRWAIWLDMSEVPKEYGDARLYFTIVEADDGKNRIDARCHVCSMNPVGPGRSVVFSIPSDYATLDAFLRLAYSFAWEHDNESEDGSTSTHAVEFDFHHLPKSALAG